MQKKLTIAIFGKNNSHPTSIYQFNTIEKIFETLGDSESIATFHAIQAVFHGCNVYFISVTEEGHDPDEYIDAINILKKSDINAIFVPGLVDPNTLDLIYNNFDKIMFLINEPDTYDFMTCYT